MKICIYFGLLKGELVDGTCPENGNPGIGGTQYCMLQLAHYLSLQSNHLISVIANREYILNSKISFYRVSDESNLIDYLNSKEIDLLILQDLSTVVRENLEHAKFKILVWSHNYIYADLCSLISKSKKIVGNIFVGKQEYDRYIDHDVIEKSTFIHNMYHDNSPTITRENDGRTVVYMGAINESKGFAELCSIWPGIINKIPNARLIVLGSGSLYGKTQLGPLGIASASYESRFIKYITDSTGKVIPSVHFLGVVGAEKTEIFRKASVGVVNPSGRTETFGMGVVEMAEAKLPVVTIGFNGHFDTVVNGKTGLLGKNLSEIQSGIIELLTNPAKNTQYGEEAKRWISQFEPNIILKKWLSVLDEIEHNAFAPVYLGVSNPMSNNQKWVRVLLRFMRFKLHLKFLPALIDIECAFVRLKGIMK